MILLWMNFRNSSINFPGISLLLSQVIIMEYALIIKYGLMKDVIIYDLIQKKSSKFAANYIYYLYRNTLLLGFQINVFIRSEGKCVLSERIHYN